MVHLTFCFKKVITRTTGSTSYLELQMTTEKTAVKSKNQAGKLTGTTIVQFHTRDCVSLFDGFVPASTNTKAIKLSVRAFSTRANLLTTQCGLGDPIAQEILVNTEKAFENFFQSCQRRDSITRELTEPFKGMLKTSSISSEPANRDCSNLAVYGMYATRACLLLDMTLRRLIGAHHITVMTKQEMEDHRRDLKRNFRAILLAAFQYKPKVVRDDFDQQNKHAMEMLQYYREKLYIRQNDTRTDEELCIHYASYDQEPKMI